MRYVCSLPNPGAEGEPKFLVNGDDALVRRFVEAENRPGRGVFYLPNPLRPGVRRHGRGGIAAIAVVFVDIDLKGLEQSPEDALAKLRGLMLAPTSVVDSGHGLHILWTLKEPAPCEDVAAFDAAVALQEALTDYLGGDRQVKPWSLLRLPGTTNSKDLNNPVLCKELQWASQ
jgi:hypothetical protein